MKKKRGEEDEGRGDEGEDKEEESLSTQVFLPILNSVKIR